MTVKAFLIHKKNGLTARFCDKSILLIRPLQSSLVIRIKAAHLRFILLPVRGI